MAVDVTHPRWRNALPYFRALPLSEKRAFYARALKFLLDSDKWSDTMRVPNMSDHANMRNMLLAFNGHSGNVMRAKASPDVVHQWQTVRYIRKGAKRRIRKRQVSRLTYEYMQLIRMFHPVRNSDSTVSERVRCMPQFQREVKKTFLSNSNP